MWVSLRPAALIGQATRVVFTRPASTVDSIIYARVDSIISLVSKLDTPNPVNIALALHSAMGSMTLKFAPLDLGQRNAAVSIASTKPRSAHASAAARHRSLTSSRAAPSLTVLAAVAATRTPIPALEAVKPIFLPGSGAKGLQLGTLAVLRTSIRPASLTR